MPQTFRQEERYSGRGYSSARAQECETGAYGGPRKHPLLPPTSYVTRSYQVCRLAVTMLHPLLHVPTATTLDHHMSVTFLTGHPFSYPFSSLWSLYQPEWGSKISKKLHHELELPHLSPPPTLHCRWRQCQNIVVHTHARLVHVSLPPPYSFHWLEEHLSSLSRWKSFTSFSKSQLKDYCFTKLSLIATTPSPIPFLDLQLLHLGLCTWLSMAGAASCLLNHTHWDPGAWSVCSWQKWELLLSSIHLYA